MENFRIIHTSDWHLGKNLEGYSRMNEQEKFLLDFVRVCEEKKPHLVLISGDIYDNPNPPAWAQRDFYETIKNASSAGECMILIIPGNHDSAIRLAAAAPLAESSGIIIVENYDDIIPPGDYGVGKVTYSIKGAVSLEIRGKRANVIMLPFISESEINSSITDISNDENENALSYQNTLEEILRQREEIFEKDGVNILMAHLFSVGSEKNGDERTVQLGSAYIIDSKIFPEKADYIALGHIHKCQFVPGTNRRAYYSGSPIHYNKSEVKTEEKFMLQADFDGGKSLFLTHIPIDIYKKIEIWKVANYSEALKLSEEKMGEDSWVYIEIKSPEIITSADIAALKVNKKDIIDIKTARVEADENNPLEDIKEISEEEKFSKFFIEQTGEEPEEKLLNKFIYFLSKAQEEEIN